MKKEKANNPQCTYEAQKGSVSGHMVGGEYLNSEQKEYMQNFLDLLVGKVNEWMKK